MGGVHGSRLSILVIWHALCGVVSTHILMLSLAATAVVHAVTASGRFESEARRRLRGPPRREPAPSIQNAGASGCHPTHCRVGRVQRASQDPAYGLAILE